MTHEEMNLRTKEALRFTMDYVENNAHILNCAYDSMGRDELKRFFLKDLYAITRNMVEECETRQGITLDDDSRDFVCTFLVEGTAGMLVNSFKERTHLGQDREKTIKNVGNLLDALPQLLVHMAERNEA